MGDFIFTNKDIKNIKSNDDLRSILDKNGISPAKINTKLTYEHDLRLLQIELLKLQNWIQKTNKRVVVIFEGRDAAGKGGSIKRFRRFLNPRSARLVALGKPSEIEKGQWYFRRHVKELPNAGEIVFFDRSWYNRAVVEPVMGFCSLEEYHQFMYQVPEFEHMLHEDGVSIIKLWFSISKEEQQKRFALRQTNPLKKWKLSPVDLKSSEVWDDYSHYIRQMFLKTHTEYAPWMIIKTNIKRVARLESIRYVLSVFDYDGKDKGDPFLFPDPNIVHRYNRSLFLTD